MDLLPFLGVFLLNALDGPAQLLFVETCRGLSSVHVARRVQDSILCSQGETGPPSGMGVLLTARKEVQLKPFADKDAAGGAETTSCKNRYRAVILRPLLKNKPREISLQSLWIAFTVSRGLFILHVCLPSSF